MPLALGLVMTAHAGPTQRGGARSAMGAPRVTVATQPRPVAKRNQHALQQVALKAVALANPKTISNLMGTAPIAQDSASLIGETLNTEASLVRAKFVFDPKVIPPPAAYYHGLWRAKQSLLDVKSQPLLVVEDIPAI